MNVYKNPTCFSRWSVSAYIYAGLDIIPTYQNFRFMASVKQSIDVLKKNESIIIFPEDSSNGYQDELPKFNAGFTILAAKALREGIDLPIYTMYYQKKKHRFIVAKPIKYSELVSKGWSKDEISEFLCQECNRLGKYE